MRHILLIVFLGYLLFSCEQKTSDQIHDIVVVGGGLMGSSSAWHLSNYGKSVLLLEKQDSSYEEGSSRGETRIARSNNRGNDIWSYLHNRSVKEIEALIEFLNGTEDKGLYSIENIYTTSPVTYVGRVKIYDQLLASLIRQRVKYDIAITPAEGKSKFDVNLPDSVLLQKEYNQHSGTINPQKLIECLHTAIRKKGNGVWYNHRVEKIERYKDHYKLLVRDSKSQKLILLKARKVISAAGPYTGKLLKNIAPYFDSLINPQRVFLAFLRIKKEHFQALSLQEREKLIGGYPVINSSTGTRSGSFFSMIEYFDQNQNPVIKIGGHFQRSNIENLDQIWKKELDSHEVEWSINNTFRYLQLLRIPIQLDHLELVDGYSCVYSLTNTEVPFVTPIMRENQSQDENFLVMGGMSGVGGKGAMAYGLIAANLFTNKTETDSLYNETVSALGFNRLKLELLE